MSSNLPSCSINLQKLEILHESPEKMATPEELPDIKVSIVDEAAEETTSNEKSEDEIEKTEIEEESVKDETEAQIEEPEIEAPIPTPSRRGKRRRRGTSRRPVTERPQVKKVEKEMVKTDGGEIEIESKSIENEETKDDDHENDAEDAEEEPEEEREPSPVVTRRSNRRQQPKKEEIQMDIDDGTNTPEMIAEDMKDTRENVTQEALENAIQGADQDEVESVTSELDSIASGSTLTTRSRRRGAPGPQVAPPKSKKGGGRVSKTGSATTNNSVNSSSTKGKSRRIIFKKSATRAPAAVARAVTSDRVYYRGQYYTKGDIVSVEDIDDGSVYYAQLRGFLTDQYCEKSGVITWLLPTVNSPPSEECFDPSTYVIGPEEDLPRKLDYFTFVMHAPDDYFYYRKAPYPTISIQTDQEYLVTRQGPRVRLIKEGRPVYQDAVPPLIPMNVQNL